MWQKYTHVGPADTLPYFVYTPANYRVGKPVPLIVMLHGCTQSAEDFAASTRMNELAEQHQFIVVYPQQTSNNNRSRCWNWFKASHQVRDRGEPALIAGIVQDIQQNKTEWTIDPRRIYVAGLSAGGAMASILGTAYPDLFAAIGVHSGLEYRAAATMIDGLRAMRRGGPDPVIQGHVAFAAMGSAARVVPLIVFHGTRDSQVHPMNGDMVVQQWMLTNHLASGGRYMAQFNEPSHREAGAVRGGRAYTLYRWADINGREVQEYWKVDGMGHGWSGGKAGNGYVDPKGPDASYAMYQFFMKHPMSVQSGEEPPLRRYLRSVSERFLKRSRSSPPDPPA